MSQTFTDMGTFPPTVIISRDPDRSGNFVCDGVADDVEIQAAIDYITIIHGSRGGKIFVRMGSYQITATVNFVESIMFEGEQGGSVEKDRGVLFTATAGVNVMFSFQGDHGDTHRGGGVKYIGIDGNREAGNVGIYVTHFLWFFIENCHIIDCESCIYIIHNFGCIIENCRIDHPTAYGIWCGEDAGDNSTGLIVSNCDIGGCDTAIGIEIDTCYNASIHDNWFEGCPAHSDTGNLHVRDSRGAKITGNLFTGTGGYDILVDQTDTTVTGIIIDSNIFRSSNGGLVSVDIEADCPHGVFSNNTSQDIPGTLLEVNSGHWVVDGNHIEGVGVTGIYIRAVRCSVTGNVINEPTDYGIRVGSEGSTVMGNVIYGSVDESNILIEGDHNLLLGNMTDYAYKHGMSIGSDYNLIIGNYVKNNAQGGNFDGIRLASCFYNYVSDNYVIDDQGTETQNNGIKETGTSDFNIIVRNYISGWVSAPVVILGVDTKLNVVSFQFQQGGNAAGIQTAQFIHADASPKGWEVDADAEWAIALGQMPAECIMVVRIKIWAVGLAAPGAGNQMRLEILINAGGDDEVFTTEQASVANKNSVTENTGVNDVIHWLLDASDDVDIDDITGKDSVEIKVKHEAAGNGDIATDAVFRVVEIEYS